MNVIGAPIAPMMRARWIAPWDEESAKGWTGTARNYATAYVGQSAGQHNKCYHHHGPADSVH